MDKFYMLHGILVQHTKYLHCSHQYELVQQLTKHFNFTPNYSTSSWIGKPSYIRRDMDVPQFSINSGEMVYIYHLRDMELVFYSEVISKFEAISLQVCDEPFTTEIWVLIAIFFPLASLLAFKPIRVNLYNSLFHPVYILIRQGLNKFGKPTIFKSLKAYVINGYKLVNIDGANETTKYTYEPMFYRSGLNKMNSFIFKIVDNGTLAYHVLQLMRYIGENERLGIRIVNRPELYLDHMRLIYNKCYTFPIEYAGTTYLWKFKGHQAKYFGEFTKLFFRENGIMDFWELLGRSTSRITMKSILRRRRGLFISHEQEPKQISYNSIVMLSLLIFISTLFGLAFITFLVEYVRVLRSLVICIGQVWKKFVSDLQLVLVCIKYVILQWYSTIMSFLASLLRSITNYILVPQMYLNSWLQIKRIAY